MLKILPRPTATGTTPQPAAAIPNPATTGGRFMLGRAGGLPAPRPQPDAAGDDENPCSTAWWPAS
jgi:hypothetical protein